MDLAAETVYAIITLVALLWAFIGRNFVKTRSVWNEKKGVEALVKADAFTAALDKLSKLDAQPPC